MSLKRILGWMLILAGLGVIIATLYFSYNIFIGKTPAPEVFKNNSSAAVMSPIDQEGIEEAIQEQIKNIVPSEFTTQLFNLISWSIFAGLLIFGGAKISAIGIGLARKES